MKKKWNWYNFICY